MTDFRMPGFRAIREAILAAPPRPTGFPFDALRDQTRLHALSMAPHLQQLLTDLRAEAERAQATPLIPLSFDLFRRFETSGDRSAFERAYFDRRRRLLGLALTAALDKTDAPLPTLEDLLWELCNEYSWALPAHLPVGIAAVQANRLPPEQVVDLFAAETAHALTEVLALLGERLDPWLHERVRAQVERRIFRPLFHEPHHFKWEWEPINWAAVCGGCAGMAALVLEDDRERLAGMIDRVVRALECFLEGFGDDGGCPEGMGYWVYGFGFYTYFADMLSRFTGGRLDLMRGEKLRRIAAFPQAVSLGGNVVVNYSDADLRVPIHPGLGSYLVARFRQSVPNLATPTLDLDQIARWGHVTRDLLWSDPVALHTRVGDGSFYLPDLAWIIDRRLIDGAMVAFSAKGGHNDEPHNHNDLGHFILHLGGESLLADLGAGRYTRQYFSRERYESLYTGSQGHSVPLINGRTQDTGADHAAVVRAYEPRPDGVRFTLDLTRAYADPTLWSFTRDFVWSLEPASRSATLRLTDTFRFAQPLSALEERFVSLRSPAVEGGVVTWRSEHGSVSLRFAPALFEPAVEQIQTETHHGELLTVYLLRLCARELSASFEAVLDLVCQLHS